MPDLTQQRLREIAARRDPAELAAAVEMLCDDKPVDRDWLRGQPGWTCDRDTMCFSGHGLSVFVMPGFVDVYPQGRHRIIENPTRSQLACLMLALSPGGE